MSPRAASISVVLTALLAGCSAPGSEDPDADASAWLEVGAAQF